MKPASSAGFIVYRKNSPNPVPMKFRDFEPPRIVKGPNRWYIEYYIRIPIDLREDYQNKEWLRMKVFRDINRYKDQEQEEYAFFLLESIHKGLYDGTENPFLTIKEVIEEEEKPASAQELSLNIALDNFLQHSKEKGLRPKTLQNYGTVVNYIKEYFLKHNNKIYNTLSSFTKEDMKSFIRDSWNNHAN